MRDVTISGNKFIECGSPVVSVSPETDRDGGAVHSGIRVKGNEFVMNGGTAVGIRGASGVVVDGNRLSGNHDAGPYRIE